MKIKKFESFDSPENLPQFRSALEADEYFTTKYPSSGAYHDFWYKFVGLILASQNAPYISALDHGGQMLIMDIGNLIFDREELWKNSEKLRNNDDKTGTFSE